MQIEESETANQDFLELRHSVIPAKAGIQSSLFLWIPGQVRNDRQKNRATQQFNHTQNPPFPHH
jgi:hypothetical protein